MRLLALAAALFLALAGPGRAGEANDVLSRHLYAGSLADGERELLPLAQSADRAKAAEAEAARGMLAFVAGIERLGQAMHRHGLETSGSRMMMVLPILRLPVPPNPPGEARLPDVPGHSAKAGCRPDGGGSAAGRSVATT
jgi:hypothetical protein